MAADLDLRTLLGVVPYDLRDSGGRATALGQLTATVAGLDQPAQLWHGPDSSAPRHPAELVQRLEQAARARSSLLIEPEATRPPTTGSRSWTAEEPRLLTLAGDECARVLTVTEWPPAVVPGWLDALAELCAEVSVHLRPLDRSAAARLLRRRLASLTSTEAVDEQAGRLAHPGVEVAADDARGLRHQLARGSTQLVHVQVLLGLVGADHAAVDAAQAELAHRARTGLAEVGVLAYEQGPGWAGLAPGGRPLRGPWRLLDAAGAAASLPLPVGPAPARAGVLAGIEPRSGRPVTVDRFRAHNPNRVVVGTSGAGKSYATKLELCRQRAAGVRVVVVDPEGEFGVLADVLGGLGLTVGEEPAGLDPVGLACRSRLSAADGLAVLTSWATALLGAQLGAVDLALLDRALGVLRADRPGTPSPADLLATLTELAAHPPFRPADLPVRLAAAAGGAVGELFAPNPDLVDPPELVVFDVRAVPDRVRPAVMACVLTWAWTESRTGPSNGPTLVVLDEAHLLLDDPAAAALLVQFARRARKYRLGLEIVTQRLSDFLRDPAGEAVLANAATKLLLGCEDRERAAVAAGLGLSSAETALLVPGRLGAGLLIGPGLRSRLQVVGSDAEHVLASNGPR